MASTKADFSQRDGRWANVLLGFGKWQNMGGYGCLVTAYANVAQANGKDIDPAGMNQAFKDRNLFSVDAVGEKTDVSVADAISRVYPDIKLVETKDWGSALADIGYFDVRSTTKTEIIVMLDYHPERAGLQQHWCRVIGTNANKTDVEVVDSYTGKRIWLSSLGKDANKLIYRAFKFSGPGSTGGSSAPAPANPPTPRTQTVTLPKHVKSWAAYREGSGLRKGTSDQIYTLSPFNIGRDLTYDIIKWVGDYAVVINSTDKGRVVIWVKDTDAIIR